MSTNSIVRASINEHIKEEASVILASRGLTVSDIFRMLLTRIAREKALPFEPLIPNEDTIEAMKAAREGDVITGGTIEELFRVLNADD